MMSFCHVITHFSMLCHQLGFFCFLKTFIVTFSYLTHPVSVLIVMLTTTTATFHLFARLEKKLHRQNKLTQSGKKHSEQYKLNELSSFNKYEIFVINVKIKKCEQLMAPECFVFSWSFSSLLTETLNYIAAPLPTMWKDILWRVL